MSVILCRWLNQEVRLSKAVDPKRFSRDFSSGYLIGEILHKHQIQDDFNMFLEMDTSISKLNNFKRLKPTLALLGICLDAKMTKDLMQEKPGAAIHLLYQLYVSLEKKNRTIIQPATKTNLMKEEHKLPQMAKRDFSMKRQQTCQNNGDKRQQLNTKSVVAETIQQMGQLKIQDVKEKETSEKVCHKNHSATTSNLITKVQIKPLVHTLPPNSKSRKQQDKEQEAQKVKAEIDMFEKKRKKRDIPGFPSFFSSSGQTLLVDTPPGGSDQGCKISGSGIQPMLQSNDNYMEEIQRRQRENAVACEQRGKRKHRFLMEQLEAQKAQQEAQQEEQLVKRLTSEAKWEQHVLVHLMQIRKQKDAILQDRLFREHQYREQREKDFQKAFG